MTEFKKDISSNMSETVALNNTGASSSITQKEDHIMAVPLNNGETRSFIRRKKLIISVLASLISPFLYGYLLTSSELNIKNVVSIVQNYNKGLNADEWITIDTVFKYGIVVVFTGGLLSNYFLKAIRYDKKTIMVGSFILFFVSYILIPHITSIWLYFLVRFISGISAGIGMNIVPGYLAYITADSGNIVKMVLPCFFGAFIVLGLLFGNISNRISMEIQMNSLKSTVNQNLELFSNSTGSYIPACVSLFNSVLMYYAKPFVQVSSSDSSEKPGFIKWIKADYLKNGFVKSIAILVFSHVINNCIGINEIVLNASKILGADFIENKTDFERRVIAKNYELVFNTIAAISSFIAPLLNSFDCIGRKVLLLSSVLICVMCWIVLFFSRNPNVRATAAILYIIAYNSGISSIPYAFISELAPAEYVHHVSLIATTVNWFSGILSAVLIKKDSSVGTRPYIYLLYIFLGTAFFCFIALLFKETKNQGEPAYQSGKVINCSFTNDQEDEGVVV